MRIELVRVIQMLSHGLDLHVYEREGERESSRARESVSEPIYCFSDLNDMLTRISKKNQAFLSTSSLDDG